MIVFILFYSSFFFFTDNEKSENIVMEEVRKQDFCTLASQLCNIQMEGNISIITKSVVSYSSLKNFGINVYIARELEVPKYITFLECNIKDDFTFGNFHTSPIFFITFLPFENRKTMFIFAATGEMNDEQLINRRVTYNLYAQINKQI